MFDLAKIEKDWQENSFCLSDKEIREIYISEGITTKDWAEKEQEIKNNYKQEFEYHHSNTDRRLLRAIFGEPMYDEDEKNPWDEYYKKLNELRKTFHISQESQKKIVEGCMDLVFKETREWYQLFDENISMEDIYYLCLKGLFEATKYCIHFTTKDCFRSYASKFMERNMIKYMAQKEGISYQNAYCIVWNYFNCGIHKEENNKRFNIKKFNYDYDKEIPEEPSKIYERTKDQRFDVDYIAMASSDEFMNDFQDSLSELEDDEEAVMRLSYDKDGYPGLTYQEISEYLGIEQKSIGNIKKRALRKVRKDNRFSKYI